MTNSSLFRDLKKIARFVRIYGFGRTLIKALGRRRNIAAMLLIPAAPRSVGMIGCGQFAFATIGYFLVRMKVGIAACYDIDHSAADSFAKFYRVPNNAQSVDRVLSDPAVKLVYIASNHATHAEYACRALQSGQSTYVEKPIAVTLAQLAALHRAASIVGARIFSGYNRPFSPAIRMLRAEVDPNSAPATLCCFVVGHVLPADHWYRQPGEGTRICGNVGHWLDLAVHMLSWGNLPDRWRIHLSWSDDQVRDENLSISLVSDRNDLVNIVLTARSEPFEGINETINLQWGNVIAKIDDFRRIDVWKGEKYFSRRFWRKDVGHRAAIAQPYSLVSREWKEVEMSTLLMLRIATMVSSGQPDADFSFAEAYSSMSALIADGQEEV